MIKLKFLNPIQNFFIDILVIVKHVNLEYKVMINIALLKTK